MPQISTPVTVTHFTMNAPAKIIIVTMKIMNAYLLYLFIALVSQRLRLFPPVVFLMRRKRYTIVASNENIAITIHDPRFSVKNNPLIQQIIKTVATTAGKVS